MAWSRVRALHSPPYSPSSATAPHHSAPGGFGRLEMPRAKGWAAGHPDSALSLLESAASRVADLIAFGPSGAEGARVQADVASILRAFAPWLPDL